MRLCVLCRFFSFETEPGNGCPTCGYSGSVSVGCDKGHWLEYGLGTDQMDFYRGIRKAKDCADFDAYTPEEIEAM